MLTGNTSPFHVAPSQYNMMDSLINTESEEFYDSNVVQGIKGEPTMTDCKFAELTSPALSFASKKLPSAQEGDLLSWVAKHPKNWMANEVLDWLYYVAGKLEVDFTVFRGESFQVITGEEICRMSQAEFQRLLPEYGKKFYDVFQEVLAESHFDKPTIFNEDSCDDSFLSSDYSVPGVQTTHSLDFTSLNRIHSGSRESVEVINGYQYDIDLTAFDCAPPICPEETYPIGMNYNCDSEHESGDNVFYEPGYGSFSAASSSSLPQIQQVPATPHTGGTMLRPNKPHAMMHPNKQRASRSFTSCCSDEGSDFEYERPKKTGNRGRKPGQTKGNHLWEFIRDLLKNNQYCGKLIKWEDRREGVFRFVQSEAVAQMWGRKKNNSGMTYEKLSRAMRYYYKRGILERVDGRRLVYKFGKNSHGWQLPQ